MCLGIYQKIHTKYLRLPLSVPAAKRRSVTAAAGHLCLMSNYKPRRDKKRNVHILPTLLLSFLSTPNHGEHVVKVRKEFSSEEGEIFAFATLRLLPDVTAELHQLEPFQKRNEEILNALSSLAFAASIPRLWVDIVNEFPSQQMREIFRVPQSLPPKCIDRCDAL